jgi:hypothetical protein
MEVNRHFSASVVINFPKMDHIIILYQLLCCAVCCFNVCHKNRGVALLLVHNFYTCIPTMRSVQCLLREYDVIVSYMKTHSTFRPLSSLQEWVALQILLLNKPSIPRWCMEV